MEVQRKQLYYTVIVPLSQQRLSTAADYCVNASIWGTVMHSCRLHILLEVQQKQLYSTVSVPLSQERLSRYADCIYQWKVTGNSFTLLCQNLYLRNAYPQLQTACTSGKSAETALLYCVSTSNSVTLIHRCRLQRLVEVQRKQLYYTVIVPLSQQRLSTAADYCVNASIWGTVMHSCRLHILLEVQQKQLYSTVSVPLSQERLSTAADCIY